MTRTRAFDLQWRIAGDGTGRAELEAKAQELERASGRKLVEFLGWLPESELPALYNDCDLCVAPGRSAMDCMACGTPVIAMGSRGYVGLLDESRCLDGMHGNFGGWSEQQESSAEAIFADIDSVIYDDQRLTRLGELGRTLVNAWFSQSDLDQRLLSCYQLVVGSSSGYRGQHYLKVERDGFAFSSQEVPARLASGWSCVRASNRQVDCFSNGSLKVAFQLEEGGKFYVASDSLDFKNPPRDSARWGAALP